MKLRRIFYILVSLIILVDLSACSLVNFDLNSIREQMDSRNTQAQAFHYYLYIGQDDEKVRCFSFDASGNYRVETISHNRRFPGSLSPLRFSAEVFPRVILDYASDAHRYQIVWIRGSDDRSHYFVKLKGPDFEFTKEGGSPSTLTAENIDVWNRLHPIGKFVLQSVSSVPFDATQLERKALGTPSN